MAKEEKKKNKVKKKTYYQISGWMLELANKYDLKDKELSVYAIIYGFSQDGRSWFSGSLEYIGNWLRVDRQNVFSRYIQPLLDKKLLKREQIALNGSDIYTHKYQAIVPSDISLIDEEDEKASQNSDFNDNSQNCEGCSQNETSLNLSDKCSQNESSSALKMRHNNYLNNNNYKDYSTSTEYLDINSSINKKYDVDGMLVNDRQMRDINDMIQMIATREIKDTTKTDLFNFLHKLYSEEKQTFLVNDLAPIKNLKGFVKTFFNEKTDREIKELEDIKELASHGNEWAIEFMDENPSMFKKLEEFY